MEDLDKLVVQASADLDSIHSKPILAEAKARYLGKASVLSNALMDLRKLPNEEKAVFGKKINAAKGQINDLLLEAEKRIEQEAIEASISREKIDISLPGYNFSKGSKHPCQVIVDKLTDFFLGLGYVVAEGNEVELDKYNFELVNIPSDHPSRDMQDSFYIDPNTLLRTQTTAVQAHILEDAKGKGPIKIICPGKTYRRDDDDLTHSHQFTQCEALVVGENVNMGMLFETLTRMMKLIFGEKRDVRFRPSFFPFTEPSIEVDVSCFECGGKGCDMCKHTGWIEVLGAGMVHPNVLRMNGFDDKKYSGFAFGVGIERLAMLSYGVDDIRKFFSSDVDFLEQFRKE